MAAVLPNADTQYYLTDQVDSVKVVTDSDGLIVTSFEYLPYGEDWITEGDTKNAPKYNSQELDKESGYYFYNARHYDPEIARFVTPDTVVDGEGSTQGWNRFSYVHNNPIRYKDPTGHNSQEQQQFLAEASKGKSLMNVSQARENLSPLRNNTNNNVQSKELDKSKDAGKNRNGKTNNAVFETTVVNGIELPIPEKYSPVDSQRYRPKGGDPHLGIDAIPRKNKDGEWITADKKNQRRGLPIVSLGAGVVEFAGEKDGYGKTIIIDHGKGVKSLYAHLDAINVDPKQEL